MEFRFSATFAAAALAAIGLGACAQQGGGTFVVDLSHPMPMFEAKGGDITKPDLSKPFKGSVPAASFGFQPVRVLKDSFKTKVGQFNWGWFTMDEHYGTHLDSTDHYQNSPDTLKVKRNDRSLEEYTVDDLIGPVVLIDISSRVRAELDKNGGKPSPDPKTTNFSNSSNATVTADDIKAIAKRVVDRAWIVVYAGWEKFFFGASENPFIHPYVNGFNYPGFNKASIDALIAVEEMNGVKFNGLVMDNLSIDSGASGLGSTNDVFGKGWYAHNQGLQRGWKFLENAANLGAIAEAKPGSCRLIVGVAKYTSASGGPARVLGECRR